MTTVINSPRIGGYDLAGALAVFGMLSVNFDALADHVGKDPQWLRAPIDWIERRAAVTFGVHAGVGISLKAHAARLTNDFFDIRYHRFSPLRRGVVLLLDGLFLRLAWPADILHPLRRIYADRCFSLVPFESLFTALGLAFGYRFCIVVHLFPSRPR